MSFLFGKKQSLGSLAEILEDGREIVNTEMKKPKYSNYSGPEVFIHVAVRVQPDHETPFEARMKVGLLKAYLLKPGVRVLSNTIQQRKNRSAWMMTFLP